jgi:hypothetical protein
MVQAFSSGISKNAGNGTAFSFMPFNSPMKSVSTKSACARTPYL